MRHPTPQSAYIHIPFCAAKCGYCDFNSYAGKMGLAERYVNALVKQIKTRPDTRQPLETIYFGGGTPSILSAPQLERILQAIVETFGLQENAEVTLEANPESALPGKLSRLRACGFNRISIGAQSFDDRLLVELGRVHTHEKFLQALASAREAGFENISFDLMFALPGQTLENVRETMARAAGLGADHISAYCLTLEEGTAFFDLSTDGMLDTPDEDLQAEMFLEARRTLTEAGYEHYEISNYALAGKRCRHNMAYWQNLPYWGFGTGAVEYVNGNRTKWESNPESYVLQMETLGRPDAAYSERLEGEELLGETAMLALRTRDGMSLNELSSRFGSDVEQIYRTELARLDEAGIVERVDSHVRLTERGLLVANEALSLFLR